MSEKKSRNEQIEREKLAPKKFIKTPINGTKIQY